MATYVNDLRLKEIGTGESSGTWGTETNTNLELIGEALGFGTEGITTNADTHTTTVADGSTDPGRAMYIKYTGTLDSACTITIAPNTMSRMHFIENGTSGSQNIIISQGTGANVTIPPGDTKAVYLDGAGSGAAVVDAFASLNAVDLKVEDDLTLTSDSAVITFGADGDTTLTHTDGSGLTLNSTNKIMFNDASQFIQGSSATVLSLGATDEIDLTATAIDVNGTMDVSGAITSSAGATITTADNTTQLTLISTDADANAGPVLDLYRNSSSPADNDNVGQINWFAENDADEKIKFAEIRVDTSDVSDGSEDARVLIQTATAGGIGTSRIEILPTETVINQDSKDLDFRVESNGNANRFFVDGGSNSGEGAVVVGHNASLGQDRVFQITGTTPDTSGMEMFKYSNDTSGPTISLSKSRGGSIGTAASVSDNDIIGTINWFADDGTDTSNYVATIHAEVDGTPGSNDTPGALVFSTTADGANSVTERMRIDDSGDVLIGQTSQTGYTFAEKLVVGDGDTNDGITIQSGSTHQGNLAFNAADGTTAHGRISYQHGTNYMQFFTNNTERIRILSTGLIAIGTTVNTVAKMHIVESESRDCLRLTNTRNPSSSAPFVATFGFNFQPNNGTSTFLACQDDLDGSPTNRCVISSNGGIANYQSNNSNLSDARLKTNIQDAPNALDIINNLKVRTFKYHDQTDEKIHTGLIAQETETVDLSLVNQDGWADKAPEGEEPYKSIYNTDLMFKMLKAIQEQQEQIEQLKTQIKTLQ